MANSPVSGLRLPDRQLLRVWLSDNSRQASENLASDYHLLIELVSSSL
jgi:hypothetical protein